MLHDLNVFVVGRLLLAAFLGAIIGLERELRHKPAGLRTNILISLGAALFTIISYEMAGNVGGDHTRIAAQIIPGIGFIGAGVVIRERGAIMGITSAATIFVMASIGMACGSGLPVTAIFATLMLLVALVLLGIAEERFGLHTRTMTFRLTVSGNGAALAEAHRTVEKAGIEAHRWQSTPTASGLIIEFDADVSTHQECELLARLTGSQTQCEAYPVR